MGRVEGSHSSTAKLSWWTKQHTCAVSVDKLGFLSGSHITYGMRMETRLHMYLVDDAKC